MALYPSLEDMQLDKLVQAQHNAFNNLAQNTTPPRMSPTAPQQSSTNFNKDVYPDLGDFLGLELSQDMIQANMPEYLQRSIQSVQPSGQPVIAPLSNNAAIPARAQVTHSIRELILCKGADGKVGVRVQAVNKGIFVCIVVKDSPAAMAGVRFGDQILQLNGVLLAGLSVEKVHKMLKTSDKNNISIVIRDRPFERTITLIKDSTDNVGFQFKNGKITAIVKDSSAAKNGLLTEHNLLEVNGQTVVAMKDKDITKIINSADKIIKITIIPSFLYDHMIKKLSTSYLRGIMDWSTAEF